MAHVLEFLRLAARKAALFLAITLLASLGLFAAVRSIPGDPVALRLKNPDPAAVARERARAGLDDALAVQWWRYASGFVAGDWGRSFTSGRAVRADVAEFLPATIELSVAAVVVGVLFGVATALGAEVLRSGAARRVSFLLGTVGLTVPVFWIGFVALLVGSGWLGWFPASGRFDPAMEAPVARTGLLVIDAILAGDGRALLMALHHLALPVACLALYPAAQVCGVLQARLQEQRLRTLVTALEARGFGPARIWLRHVARVASAPVVAVVGSNFGMLLGGAVLVETVFSWPGLGRFLVEAVLARDVFVVENVLLLVVLLVVAVVFAADTVAWLLHPAAARGEEGET
jgi:ABC-type dipeptide/oligopeptide/nickel transport system permease component